jgi:photosystem II stability/assembly factor-like uncharacterized protein
MNPQNFDPSVIRSANRRLAWSTWSLRLPSGIAARWALGAGIVFVAALWGALRQPPRPNPLQPESPFSFLLYPRQTNAFVEPVIRSHLTTVFPMPDGRTIWAGGTGGLLIVSRDAGATWDTAAVYAPASWDSIVAARRLEATTTDTTVVSIPTDTTQGQATYPTDSAAFFAPQSIADTLADTTTTALRTTDPARPSANPVQVLLRAVGTLATPAPLYAQITGSAPVTAPSVTRKVRLKGGVSDLFFLDSQRGWAVTSWGDVLATRDGGTRWDLYPSATPSFPETGTLGFADSLRGMVSGGGGMMHTSDGGRTWITTLSDSTINGRTVGGLVAGGVGYALDENNGNLLRTDDAGASWRAVPAPRTGFSEVSGIYFRDTLTGWIAYPEPGDRNAIYQTRDGARSWRLLTDQLPRSGFRFSRAGGPLIAWSTAGILRSVDGAAWDTMQLPVPRPRLFDFTAGADGNVWAVGTDGLLLVSHDTARTWQVLTGGRALLATAFANRSRGWAVGLGGMLLRTYNGGDTWEPRPSGTTADLHSIAFRTPDGRFSDGDAWAVGDQGTVVRSRNGTYGPRSWTPQRLGTSASETLHRVQFADSLTGWISGDSTLLRTVDGGRTWQRLPFPADLREIQFTSTRNGWAARGSEVLRTTDGGSTWQAVSSPSYELIERLWFAGDSVGWKLIKYSTTIHITRDGGRSWAVQPFDGAPSIHQMRMVDERTGYAVGAGGAVYRTTDGGARWQRDSVPTRRDLFDVSVVEGSAWAVGSGGAIFRRGDAGEWQGLRTTTAPAGWLYLVIALLAGSVVVAMRRADESERTAPNAESVEALLISDRPLQPGDPDPFDLNGLALGVSKFLRNPRTRPPLTIAVTGRWGTGKSSLMNLIRRDLEANRFRPVWFNAWHHQKEEHLLAALLESIRAQAVPRWLSFSGLLFRARLFWIRVKRHRPSAIVVSIATAVFLGYLAADQGHAAQLWTGLSRTALDPIGAGRRWVDGLADDFTGGGSASAAAYLTLAAAGLAAAVWRAFRAFGVKPAALMATLAGKARLRDLQQQTGFRYQFAQEFSEVMEALHPMDMVLFVDDLDRCRPEQVLEVLESINFLVSSGDCVVVMGMDREWVIRCVGLAFDQIAQESAILSNGAAEEDADEHAAELKKRTNRGEFARHYLEKLVNIEIPVPVPTADQLRGLVRSSGTERRRGPGDAATLLPTTRLRVLRDPRTAAYVALGAAVFSLSVLAFRPRAAAENIEAGFQALSSAAANAAAPATDTAAAAASPGPASTPLSMPAPEPELPGELVGAPPAEREWGGLMAGVTALVLAMGLALLQRRDALVQDSRTFTTALGAWSGVIASRGFTPRITKKFLNRLRYYAMRQRAYEPTPTRAQRLLRALGRVWHAFWSPEPPSAPAAAEEATPVISLEERRAAREEAIPESVLVALACLHECYPDGTPRQAYEDFHRFVRENELTKPFSAEILSPELDYPPSIAPYRKRFETISAGVRIH